MTFRRILLYYEYGVSTEISNQTPEAIKRYREAHLEYTRDYQNSYNKLPEVKAKRFAYRKANSEKQMLYNAKSQAKKRGIPFNLVESDIKIPKECPILGIPLFCVEGKPSANSPTLDQINPGKGYVKDNICVISHRANTMKQNNTIEDFERFIRYMKGTL